MEALQREGINTSRQTVWRLEQHIDTHGTIMPLPKSGRPTKLTDATLMKVDKVMLQDDETTVKELVVALRTIGVSVLTFTALAVSHLAGHPAIPPIVNLSAHLTARRDFAGRRKTLGPLLRM